MNNLQKNMSQIKEYLSSTSPLSRLANKKSRPLKDIRNSVHDKIAMIGQNKKSYIEDHESSSYSELKASSFIYKVPEFSPPQTNYQVSDKLKSKMNMIKSQIITKLPVIKSSNYNPSRVDSFTNHRTVVKELQEWLRIKLQNPPLTHDDSIEYKNMIMGIGMKEVIRLIGTRCSEEANMVSEIWELTWGICKQIIMYLSKRAHKCQQILSQEISFLRKFYDEKIIEGEGKAKKLSEQNEIYKNRSDKLAKEVANLKKKNKNMKLSLIGVEDMNTVLKKEFEGILQENLLLHLNNDAESDKKKKDWARRMYANLVCEDKNKNSQFRDFMFKIMTENNYIADTEDFGDFQLKNDINQFKAEEQARRSIIAKQLHEKFIKMNRASQTHKIDLKDAHSATQKIQQTDYAVVTDKKETVDGSANTIESALTVKKPKGIKTGRSEKPGRKPNGNQKRKMVQFDSVINNSCVNGCLTEEKSGLNESMFKSHVQVQTECFLDTEKVEKPGFYVTSIAVSRKKIEVQSERPKSPKHQTVNQKIEVSQKVMDEQGKRKSKILEIDERESLKQMIKSKQEQIKQKDQYINELTKRIKTIEQDFLKGINESRIKVEEKDKSIIIREENKQPSKRQSFSKGIKKNQPGFNSNRSSSHQQNVNFKKIQSHNSIISPAKKFKTNHLEPSTIPVDRSVPQSKQRIRQEKKSNSEHRNSHRISVHGLLSQKRQGNNGQNGGQSVSQKSSKVQSIAQYFGEQILQKSEFKIEGETVEHEQLCEQYLEMKLENYRGLKNLQNKSYQSNLDAYLEMVKQIKTQPYHAQEKHMKSMVEKIFPPIFKDLAKEIQQGMKLKKIQQLKQNYVPLPVIVFNKFNRNFGVKKVAHKHLKDFLLCLYHIQEFTNKYSVIWYFMGVSDHNQQDLELFFFYMLITTLLNSTQKILSEDDLELVKELAQEHLANDFKFINKIKFQGEETELVALPHLFSKIIISYHEYCTERERDLQFLYKSFTWTAKNFSLHLFLTLISVIPMPWKAQEQVLRGVLSVLQAQRQGDKFFTKPLFFRLIKKCPDLNSFNLVEWTQNYQNNIISEIDHKQLMVLGKKSQFMSNCVASILNQKRNSRFLDPWQVKFLERVMALYLTHIQTNQILGSLTFFEERNSRIFDLILSDKKGVKE